MYSVINNFHGIVNDICTLITANVFVVNSTAYKKQRIFFNDLILYWVHILYMGAKFHNLGLGPKA